MRTEQQQLTDLYRLLSYGRPAYGVGVATMIAEMLLTLPGARQDQYGNVLVATDAQSAVLYSCHTDTVHRSSADQLLQWQDDAQTVLGLHSSHLGRLDYTQFDQPRCLGADCSAGVWLMREMVLAGIPGQYVFHYAEEIGGIGSQALASHRAFWLKSFDYAIAFDRRGTGDVITHQAGGRCCSTDFALALAAHLGGRYRPDDSGVFTDTANYTDLIGECTNISVGYHAEHTQAETLDVAHLQQLLERLLTLDANTLPCVRVPGEDDDPYVDISLFKRLRTKVSADTPPVQDDADPCAGWTDKGECALCAIDADGDAGWLRRLEDGSLLCEDCYELFKPSETIRSRFDS